MTGCCPCASEWMLLDTAHKAAVDSCMTASAGMLMYMKLADPAATRLRRALPPSLICVHTDNDLLSESRNAASDPARRVGVQCACTCSSHRRPHTRRCTAPTRTVATSTGARERSPWPAELDRLLLHPAAGSADPAACSAAAGSVAAVLLLAALLLMIMPLRLLRLLHNLNAARRTSPVIRQCCLPSICWPAIAVHFAAAVREAASRCSRICRALRSCSLWCRCIEPKLSADTIEPARVLACQLPLLARPWHRRQVLRVRRSEQEANAAALVWVQPDIPT